MATHEAMCKALIATRLRTGRALTAVEQGGKYQVIEFADESSAVHIFESDFLTLKDATTMLNALESD